MSKTKKDFWNGPLTGSRIKSDDVKLPEMLIGYFIGPFGALLASGIFTSILQNYFTDVLKLNLTFLTTLQLFSTILIVAANLIVGQLIERTRTMAGKARPWILLSALTLSIASVLMFVVPFEGTAKMVWIAIAYNLFYAVAYPIYNTANSTLIPVSTRDSKRRGALASAWTTPTTSKATAWSAEEQMSEGTAEEKTVKTASLKEQLSAVTSEKMWWIVMLFYMGFQWSGAMKNGSMTYFCKWVMDNTFFGTADAWGASQSLLSIMGAVPMAVAAVAIVPLCNKFGKRIVCMIGMLLGSVGGVIAIMGNGQIVPVAIGVALKCLGSAPACYMILAMLADVIDHIEYKSGIRTDGLTMSIYSSIMVAATPVCNSIFSAILNASGYDQAADIALGTAAQTAAAQTAISVGYIWVETIAYVICAVLIFFFTIEKDLPEEQQAIAARKNK